MLVTFRIVKITRTRVSSFWLLGRSASVSVTNMRQLLYLQPIRTNFTVYFLIRDHTQRNDFNNFLHQVL